MPGISLAGSAQTLKICPEDNDANNARAIELDDGRILRGRRGSLRREQALLLGPNGEMENEISPDFGLCEKIHQDHRHQETGR